MSTQANANTVHHASKVAIVTGASRGIGAAIARRLAADGIAVVVNYAGRAADAQAVVAEIEAAGGRAAAVQADVAVPAQVAAMFDQAITLFGGVDIVVNNAGIMQPGLVPLVDTDDTLFDRLVAINLKGTFNTLRVAAKKLRSGGRIVNFGSSIKELATPGYSVYAATKAAVETMTNIFAKELRGRNITVNAVAPGPTATELFLKDKTPEQVERLAKMPPLERLGQPEDISSVVAFLVSSAADWIDGQTLRVNGGIV
ncbi:glucose 1-dehydrogenase [Paraburkholderia kururiensis]|uniref:Glucose 1-dehydrogenase n=1 Tax=Paraburkholderia kururiensis TaxID=984307 RepID=A0ABZ0WQ68_9BURK|nr:glucose 1-dehydrogenase [Paraburkholderia kururiensis]WQD79539.1 glucose 1-dehydrogenase [Paraburkholderia kururiensis]